MVCMVVYEQGARLCARARAFVRDAGRMCAWAVRVWTRGWVVRSLARSLAFEFFDPGPRDDGSLESSSWSSKGEREREREKASFGRARARAHIARSEKNTGQSGCGEVRARGSLRNVERLCTLWDREDVWTEREREREREAFSIASWAGGATWGGGRRGRVGCSWSGRRCGGSPRSRGSSLARARPVARAATWSCA